MIERRQPKEKYELTRDQLLGYVEIDLWGRFQKRMWATVGIVLTGITVAGFLGVPYYIRSEVDSRIRASTETFERKSADLLAHAKLLIEVSAKYDEARARMYSDANRLLRALDQLSEPAASSDEDAKKKAWRFRDVHSELSALLSKGPTDALLSTLDRSVMFISDDEAKRRLLPSKSIVQEIVGVSSMTRSVTVHPVHDGTLKGALQDLRFQTVVVDALRLSKAAITDRIRSLGGSSPTDVRIEEAKVGALETSLFQPELTRTLTAISTKYLRGEDRTKFAEVQGLYLQGITDKTADIPKEPKQSAPPTGPSAAPSTK